jgi:beta-N-acetylhexosaminidase
VPVDERDVAAATPEVVAGAAGIILFGSDAPATLATAVAALDRAGPGGAGLLVMADEEGGGVQRLANLVGDLPWARTLGEGTDPAGITAQVAAMGARMRAAGVDVDLAPVLDVDGRDVAPGPADPDGVRSFGGDLALVSADGQAYMEGLQASGVLPVIKHFPGLGGATGNTDDGPADTLPWSVLQTEALPAFADAIENGAPAVMVANAAVPGLTALPASLSQEVIEGVLHGSLGFRGLVVTDSLSARAISGAGYSVPAAATRAVRAGADLTLWAPPGGPTAVARQFAAVVAAVSAAVADGTLDRDRLVAAAEAVLSARHVAVCP